MTLRYSRLRNALIAIGALGVAALYVSAVFAGPDDLARVHPVRGDWLIHSSVGLYVALPLLTVVMTGIGLRAAGRALLGGVAASLVGKQLIVRGKGIPLLASTSISLTVRRWAHIVPVRTILFTVHDDDGHRHTATLSLSGIAGGMDAVRKFMLFVELARPAPPGSGKAALTDAAAATDTGFDPDAIIARYLAAKQAGTPSVPLAAPRATFGKRAV